MAWAALFGAIAGPIAKRVLAALGFGIITYGGYQAMYSGLENILDTMLSALSPALYQILALAGLVDVIGIWLGALATVVAISAFGTLGRLSQ